MQRTILFSLIVLSFSLTTDGVQQDVPTLTRALSTSKAPFNILFSGRSKQFRTITNFRGRVKGVGSKRNVRAKFAVLYRGSMNSFGFKGRFRGTQEGSYTQNVFGAFAKGNQTVSFGGRLSGIPMRIRTTAVFRLRMRSNGFKYTERGSFSAKNVTGTYEARWSGTTFKVEMRGVRAGKKFRFRYGGHYAAFTDVFTMKIIGRYRGTVGKKEVSGPLNFPTANALV